MIAGILFSPLIASILISLTGIRKPNRKSAWIALSGLLASFLFTWDFIQNQGSLFSGAALEISYSWINIAGLQIEFGFLINSLSIVMLFVVLIVAAMVFYYSIEYMEHDESFGRYYAYLSLFAFSMIGIVLSNNLLQLFIFWELVGMSSYLLIGFWYQKNAAADAGKKAFLTNRVGDFGFLIGIILLWNFTVSHGTPTLNLLKIDELLSHAHISATELNHSLFGISLLLFCGVLGKSAQFPLHVWLPDAMEGPTPVSALIHAATMVAAGVYLLARTFPIYTGSPAALELIAYVGGFTAIFAATQALVQTDIKRILAYSTLSQLGYMVMAVGLGSAGIAMYHLTTHAFFKALLFLGAGSVIHMTHEQDVSKLGGLAKKMPVTAALFMIGSLALSGIYPLSGFFSKDEILTLALERNWILFITSIITAFLTAFYTTRAVILTFFGHRESHHGHEPRQWMIAPLSILAFLSIISGFLGIEKLLHQHLDHPIHFNLMIAITSSIIAISGIILSIIFYQIKPELPGIVRVRFESFHTLLSERYYIDHFYNWILNHVQAPIAQFCERFEHRAVIGIMVNGTANLTASFGDLARKLQTGRIQTYLTVFFGGVIVMIYCFVRGIF